MEHGRKNPNRSGDDQDTGIKVDGREISYHSDLGRSVGRGMIVVAWIGVIAILAYFLQKLSDQQTFPNSNITGVVTADGARQITLQRSRNGHYFATGKINGVKVRFLLDTGATNVSVPADIAAKIGLEKGVSYPIRTANGIGEEFATVIKSLTIGTIEVTDVRAGINPNYKSESILLGMNVLKKFRMVQQGNTLTIQQLSN